MTTFRVGDTGNMTYDQALELVQKRGYQQDAIHAQDNPADERFDIINRQDNTFIAKNVGTEEAFRLQKAAGDVALRAPAGAYTNPQFSYTPDVGRGTTTTSNVVDVGGGRSVLQEEFEANLQKAVEERKISQSSAESLRQNYLNPAARQVGYTSSGETYNIPSSAQIGYGNFSSGLAQPTGKETAGDVVRQYRKQEIYLGGLPAGSVVNVGDKTYSSSQIQETSIAPSFGVLGAMAARYSAGEFKAKYLNNMDYTGGKNEPNNKLYNNGNLSNNYNPPLLLVQGNQGLQGNTTAPLQKELSLGEQVASNVLGYVSFMSPSKGGYKQGGVSFLDAPIFGNKGKKLSLFGERVAADERLPSPLQSYSTLALFSMLPPVLSKSAITGFTGYETYKTVKEPTTEHFAGVLTMGGIGLVGEAPKVNPFSFERIRVATETKSNLFNNKLADNLGIDVSPATKNNIITANVIGLKSGQPLITAGSDKVVRLGTPVYGERIPLKSISNEKGIDQPKSFAGGRVFNKMLELTPQEEGRMPARTKVFSLLGQEKGMPVKEFIEVNLPGVKNPKAVTPLVERFVAGGGTARGELFGGYPTLPKGQLPEPYTTKNVGDIDVAFKRLSVEQIARRTEKLTFDLQNIGEDVVFDPKENAIMFRGGNKFLEAKSGLNQEVLGLDDVSPPKIWGFNLESGKTLPFGKARAIYAGESMMRSGAGASIVSPGRLPGETKSFSEAGILGKQGNLRGLKDTAAYFQKAKGLAQIKSQSWNPFSRAKGKLAEKYILKDIQSYKPQQQLDILAKLKERTGYDLVLSKAKPTRKGIPTPLIASTPINAKQTKEQKKPTEDIFVPNIKSAGYYDVSKQKEIKKVIEESKKEPSLFPKQSQRSLGSRVPGSRVRSSRIGSSEFASFSGFASFASPKPSKYPFASPFNMFSPSPKQPSKQPTSPSILPSEVPKSPSPSPRSPSPSPFPSFRSPLPSPYPSPSPYPRPRTPPPPPSIFGGSKGVGESGGGFFPIPKSRRKSGYTGSLIAEEFGIKAKGSYKQLSNKVFSGQEIRGILTRSSKGTKAPNFFKKQRR